MLPKARLDIGGGLWHHGAVMMKRFFIFCCAAAALALNSCITSAVAAAAGAASSAAGAAAGTAAAAAGTATAATGVSGTAATVQKASWLSSLFSSGAPESLQGKTLTLNIPVSDLSGTQTTTISVSYSFVKANESQPSAGGLVLSYLKTGENTATATLSGDVPTVYELVFTSGSSGTVTIQRTTKVGASAPEQGSFTLNR